MRKGYLLIFLLLILSIFFSREAFAGIFKSVDPVFQLDIPDNFRAMEEDLLPSEWDAGFRESTGLEDKQPITVGIDIMDREMSPGYKLDMKQIGEQYPKGAKIDKRLFRALGLDLPGVKVTLRYGAVESILYRVSIPVENKGIVLIVGGTAERKKDILELVHALTSSMQARTNWTGKYRPGMYDRMFFSAGMAALVLLGFILRRFRWVVRRILWDIWRSRRM